MVKTNYDKVQTELIRTIEENAPHTFAEPLPVSVTLDNGVKYDGVAYEVQAKSASFPAGLVMVRAGNTDIGVPVSYIRAR